MALRWCIALRADVLIGAVAFALVLLIAGEGQLARWGWGRIAMLTAIAGVAYTTFGEWRNTTVLRNWAYSKLMPTLEMAGVEIGMSPLAQWIVLPPLALYLARRSAREPGGAEAV